jgi:hypothetical protein
MAYLPCDPTVLYGGCLPNGRVGYNLPEQDKKNYILCLVVMIANPA